MRFPRWLIGFLAVWMLVSIACGISGDVNSPNQTGVEIFRDDFSLNSGGWDVVRTEEGITDFEDGGYRIKIEALSTDVWSNPSTVDIPADVSIEVDATKHGGPDDNDFGVICRYKDAQNYYFLVISSDGYLGIGKVIAGKSALIQREEMPPSEAIQRGSVTNHLRVDCIGNTLTLYVNNQFVDSQQDGDLTSGNVGLIAGTFSQGGVDILFDNFVVRRP